MDIQTDLSSGSFGPILDLKSHVFIFDFVASLHFVRSPRPLTLHQVVWALAVSRDGSRIFSGSADTTVRVWEAETGREALTLSGHTQVSGFSTLPTLGHGVSRRSTVWSCCKMAGWRAAVTIGV